MSKELTPLEALEELRQNNKDDTHLFDNKLLDIIETALKDYEKRLILAKEYKDVNNVAKRLKALEIIKEKQIYTGMLIHDIEEHYMSYEEYLEQYDCYQQILIPLTQEEYDLLKEVLL